MKHHGAYAYVCPLHDLVGRNAELDTLKDQLATNYGPDGHFTARRINAAGEFDEFGDTIAWTYDVEVEAEPEG